MESNWRWNVWEIGLGGGDVQLAARLLDVPFRTVYICLVPGVFNCWFYEMLDPDRGYVPIAIRTEPGHFPFGFGEVVEPD